MSKVVLVEDNMSLEEGSLGNSTVLLLGFHEHDGFVFQIVVNGQLSDSVVLKSALDDVFLAETEESQDLFVKLGVNRLKLFVDVAISKVVGVLVVRKRLACSVLGFTEVGSRRSGNGVERHRHVFVVSDLLKVNVRDFLVASDGWVVSHNVSG